MKLLLVNQAFHPDLSASSQLLTDLAQTLVKNNCDVTVLTSGHGYLRSHESYPKDEIYKGIRIKRVLPSQFRRGNKLFRILDALLMNASFAWKLLLLPRYDKIVCLTSPPLIAWVAHFVARRPRQGFVYWVMDINPDQAIEAGWVRKGSVVARGLEGILKAVLKKSEKVIVLDRYMKERLVGKGIDENKVHVSHLWSDLENIYPVSHSENVFRDRHQLKDKFVVMYAGNLSVCHPLNTILEAAHALRDDKHTHFVFLGGGARTQEVLEFSKERELENIIYLPYEDRVFLKHALSAGDLHLVSMGERYVGILHPSKIYGIIAAGRPSVLIGPQETFIADHVVKNGLGHRVEHDDIEGLVGLICQAKERSSEEAALIAEQTRSYAERFHKEKMTAALAVLVIGDRSSEGTQRSL